MPWAGNETQAPVWAKVIKIADKIANLSDLIASPPTGWPLERCQQYVEWSNRVVAGCRGQSERLEKIYDARAMEASALGYRAPAPETRQSTEEFQLTGKAE